jgi:O-antigen ligase
MADTAGPRAEPNPVPPQRRGLRITRSLILVVCGLGLVAWVLSFVPIYRYWGDPRADGFHAIPAFYATAIGVPFVLPAFVLAAIGRPRGLHVASILFLVAVGITLVIFGPLLLLFLASWFVEA